MAPPRRPPPPPRRLPLEAGHIPCSLRVVPQCVWVLPLVRAFRTWFCSVRTLIGAISQRGKFLRLLKGIEVRTPVGEVLRWPNSLPRYPYRSSAGIGRSYRRVTSARLLGSSGCAYHTHPPIEQSSVSIAIGYVHQVPVTGT
jgi:hypothetical protein